MRKIIFAAFAALLTVGCGNSIENEKEAITDTLPQEIRAKERIDTIFAMADAFAMQESRMTEDAVSPCGKYVGCLQISEIMVREANRIVGFECFNYDDRYDRQGSYAIFRIVQEHHNKNLDIDRAIDLWNPRCDAGYRENVRNFYNNNLLNYNEHDNCFR